MASKRPKLSFAELEPRGKGAILRSAEEFEAEQALLAAQAAETPPAVPPEQVAPAATNGTWPSARRPTNRPASPSNSQSTNRPASRLVARPVDRIVDRPKAFYITERLDQRLDEAVRYFQRHHGLRKVDRSTLVNVLLGDDALWTEDALDRLIDRLVSQLTSRLTS